MTKASGKRLWIGIAVVGIALVAIVALPMLIEQPDAPAGNANAREIVLAPLADMPPDVQNASSIAAMVLTTEALVTNFDIEKDEKTTAIVI